MERTLVILKPDALQRRLIGEIISRFERKGLKVVGLKLAVIPRPLAETHYAVHKEKSFYPSLLQFVTAGPVVLMVLEGNKAIEVVRKLMGKTFGHQAEPGTIRGDFGISSQFNLVHGSDSPESAERELKLFFKPEELLRYPLIDDPWMAE
ncbi:MAG: nucleoside-diphosphate kinase [Planctomycetes bacterium]|nr:nucleoside-diphosphate kinase [Planctomycetota bacterium]